MACLGLALNAHAQPCDPSISPSGLSSTYTPGTGFLLQWNAVPGSVGVMIKASSPSGSTIKRRIISFERDQFMVPEAVLSPGVYGWQVQAACSTIPPYSVTPFPPAIFFSFESSPDCGTVTDIDGNVYNTVQIGSQCWTKGNLKVERFRNGDSIPTGLSDAEWQFPVSGPSGSAAAVYNDSAAYKDIYGLLYNWHAAVDARGICPAGWHVPSDLEWTDLVMQLDPLAQTFYTGSLINFQSFSAGDSLKTFGNLYEGTGPWAFSNYGATNSSGFSALPGGYRNFAGLYDNRYTDGYWWSTTENSTNNAFYRSMNHDIPNVRWNLFTKAFGLSVRCVKD